MQAWWDAVTADSSGVHGARKRAATLCWDGMSECSSARADLAVADRRLSALAREVCEQAEVAGARDSRSAAMRAELGVEVADVCVDGVHRQGELGGEIGRASCRERVYSGV